MEKSEIASTNVDSKKDDFQVPLPPKATSSQVPFLPKSTSPQHPPRHSPQHHPYHGHHHPHTHSLLVPSPIPCRRTRTTSTSRLAADSLVQEGTIVSFCREKGHGFVKPDDEDKPIFLHISDIEDEYVVRSGDRVEFRTIPMPPKKVERMAVEVHLISLDESVPHERWDNKPDI